jgi:hypothetical protein
MPTAIKANATNASVELTTEQSHIIAVGAPRRQPAALTEHNLRMLDEEHRRRQQTNIVVGQSNAPRDDGLRVASCCNVVDYSTRSLTISQPDAKDGANTVMQKWLMSRDDALTLWLGGYAW